MGSERYERHLALDEIGSEAQERLGRARAVVVGCGALGSIISQLLVRAGVGLVRVVDSDRVELSNLQRQLNYGEPDIESGRFKAELSAELLAKINSEVSIEPVVTRVSAANVEEVLSGVDICLDGTDNFETRYLLNDTCVKLDIPWVYGGVTGTTGMIMPILPGRTPCLRCVFPEPPQTGNVVSPEPRGVLNATATAIGSMQAASALRILAEEGEGGGQSRQADLEPRLLCLDLWRLEVSRVKVLRSESCPSCAIF
jgi:adenylyltransferase/sulfurtransferase